MPAAAVDFTTLLAGDSEESYDICVQVIWGIMCETLISSLVQQLYVLLYVLLYMGDLLAVLVPCST